MIKWFNKHPSATIIFIFVIASLLTIYILYVVTLPTFTDTPTDIHRQIRAYSHTPEGNTVIYYKGGTLTVKGIWYFTDSRRYYEIWRENDSNIWNVDPYR